MTRLEQLERDAKEMDDFYDELNEKVRYLQKLELDISNPDYGYQRSFFDTDEECELNTKIYTTYINKVISYYKRQLGRCEEELEMYDK